VKTLLEAGARVREAQEAALGGGSPERLRSASEKEHRAIAELVDAAAGILSESGHPASDQTRQRIAATLRAASTDETHKADLEQGRLTADLDPSGFGPLMNAPAAARRSKPAEPSRSEMRHRRERERRSKLEAEVRELESSLAEAERDAQAAQREATKRQAAVDEVRRRLERAESELRRSPD